MEQNGNPNHEPATRPDQLLICLDDLYRELENQTLIDKLIKENPNADREEICRSVIKITSYSTKEAVGNILAHNPQIASGPPDSDNPAVYLMNARIWCIEQIRKQKAAKKPAETEPNTIAEKPERESWLWKLYEVTLKVIVDAVLRWWVCHK